MLFRGSFVAIVTPLDKKGRIDFRSLEQFVEWQIREGTDGIVCCGATGEATSLSFSERRKIIETCVKVAADRVPVIAGTGTPDTRETVRLTEMAKRLGAAGCLVITPFYNKPSQRGCVLHYREVAKVALPLIVYHNPGRTQVMLTHETLAEIGTIEGVVGVKEATGDLEFIRRLRGVFPLPILSGDDWLTYEVIRAGGDGAISTIGNVIPRVWKEMIYLSLKSDWVEGKKISDQFQPLCKALFLETNPQCVKYVLGLSGRCNGKVRLPLVEPLLETQQKIKQTLVALSLPGFSQSSLVN